MSRKLYALVGVIGLLVVVAGIAPQPEAALAQADVTLLWRYETGGNVDSSPAMVDGVAYVGSDDKYLYALDARTGDLRWQYETGDDVNSSPAVVDGVVYFGSDDDYLYALNAPRATPQRTDGTTDTLSSGTQRIAFHSERDGDPDIYVMNANGSNPIRLTDHPAEDRLPAWSPSVSGGASPSRP